MSYSLDLELQIVMSCPTQGLRSEPGHMQEQCIRLTSTSPPQGRTAEPVDGKEALLSMVSMAIVSKRSCELKILLTSQLRFKTPQTQSDEEEIPNLNTFLSGSHAVGVKNQLSHKKGSCANHNGYQFQSTSKLKQSLKMVMNELPEKQLIQDYTGSFREEVRLGPGFHEIEDDMEEREMAQGEQKKKKKKRRKLGG
ncbi:hypothetical protein STEG23_016018, partial [Scotinomys teguina]